MESSPRKSIGLRKIESAEPCCHGPLEWILGHLTTGVEQTGDGTSLIRSIQPCEVRAEAVSKPRDSSDLVLMLVPVPDVGASLSSRLPQFRLAVCETTVPAWMLCPTTGLLSAHQGGR